MKLTLFFSFAIALSFLPVCAETDRAQLRGLEPVTTFETDVPASKSEAPVDAVKASQPPEVTDAPVFTDMPNRITPPDPGVVSEKSKWLRLPTDNSNDDQLNVKTTPAENLIPVGKDKLSPIKLEATYNEPVSLKDVLLLAKENNLPIQISKTDVEQTKYKLLGSLSTFLPSMSLNYVTQKVRSGTTVARSDPMFVTLIYPVFQGGSALFTSLQRFHEMKASSNIYRTSINDVLLDAYLKYYDVVLNQALLDLRAKSLEVARNQLSINQDLKTSGMGTDFEVMQTKTLYSLEKQRLVRQEVELRRSALQLCVTLNKSMMFNLIPSETQITRHALVEPSQSPELLTSLAIQNRPELARWEQLRLAARNASMAAAGTLLPRAAFFTNNSIGIGADGANIIIPTGGGSAAGGITTSVSGDTATKSFASGFILNWLIGGAGLESASNVLVARMNTRKAVLEARQELLRISAEVRDAYIDTRATETEIDVTSDAVAAASEQLRMANVRITHQIGTNLEVVQAQRDYIDAVSRRIDAFIRFKKSQAKLLHATGLISVETLTATQPQNFKLRRKK